MTAGEIAYNGFYGKSSQFKFSRLSRDIKTSWESAASAVVLELAKQTMIHHFIPLQNGIKSTRAQRLK